MSFESCSQTGFCDGGRRRRRTSPGVHRLTRHLVLGVRRVNRAVHFGLLVGVLCAGVVGAEGKMVEPWRRAGLTDEQAAAHLLDRFAFGARPGDVERVLAMGLETWFEDQLAGKSNDAGLEARLEGFSALSLPGPELARTYVPRSLVRRMAEREGISRDEAGRMDRDSMVEIMGREGFRPVRELISELRGQKLLRAVMSENQLEERMTDFWFNHFNVSVGKGPVGARVLAYERDAIRPHALGGFRQVLGATARHPAMLLYLDNALSSAEMDARPLRRYRMDRCHPPSASRGDRKGRKRSGINENYGRELLELHTLGVNGGYSQSDVQGAARVFTGWGVVPIMRSEEGLRRELERDRRRGLEPIREGDFLFRPALHDTESKVVLGHDFDGSQGIEEAERLLDALAAHPATARHVASQLALRFISDLPDSAAVERIATAWAASGGETRAALRAIFEDLAFWESHRQKIRPPLDLVVAAVRGLGAEVEDPGPLARWIDRMGQPLYSCDSPTGYIDRAERWLSPGGQLIRMEFGFAAAAGLGGAIVFAPARIMDGGELDSLSSEFDGLVSALLPGRPGEPIGEYLAASADEARGSAGAGMTSFTGASDPGRSRVRSVSVNSARSNESVALERAIGLILGSPEFQRR